MWFIYKYIENEPDESDKILDNLQEEFEKL